MKQSNSMSTIILGVCALAVLVGGIWWVQGRLSASSSATQTQALHSNSIDSNPSVDPGTALNGTKAPNFTLIDQFGQPVSLSQYRGKVVLLAFIDSECTTVCPLTSVSMLDAIRNLGPEAKNVQLLAVNANPDATAVSDVHTYSVEHGMLFHWHFLTGTKKQLEKVWRDYHMYAGIVNGQVDHTPGLYLINAKGQEEMLYMTQMAYAGISAQAEILTNEMNHLLHSQAQSLPVALPTLTPELPPSLPVVQTTSGATSLKLGKSAHWFVFFATWIASPDKLQTQLEAIAQYKEVAQAKSWPPLVYVDEETTEPSLRALKQLAQSAESQLGPIAMDTNGETADAVGVQDIPWVVLVSASGKVLWSHDGWTSASQMEQVTVRLHAKLGK